MRSDISRFDNFVNGQDDPLTTSRQPVIDPATGEAVATVPISGEPDVERASSAAAVAFETWKRSTPRERSERMLAVAGELQANADELVRLESLTTGKPLHAVAEGELPGMIDCINFFAASARIIDGIGVAEYEPGFTSSVRREPIGVCGQITPWNYPLNEAAWQWAPAVAAGNTVVLKPASTTPLSTVLMAKIASKHLPPGVLNVVCGTGSETGAALVRNNHVRMISVVGSPRTGVDVMRAAADGLKPTHLELGGNAPVLVFPDTDIEATASAVAEAGYYNTGQDCTAACRVLVHGSVHDEFVSALVAAAELLKVGLPGDRDSFCGPLNSAQQRDRVVSYLDTVDSGSVLTIAQDLPEKGFFLPLSIVLGLPQEHVLIQEEVFGPVISVQRFSDESDGFRMANGVHHDLAASVWTTDHGIATRASRELRFGTVWINCHLTTVSEMPHGGLGQSGTAKDLSRYSMESYTQVKHVMTYAI